MVEKITRELREHFFVKFEHSPYQQEAEKGVACSLCSDFIKAIYIVLENVMVNDRNSFNVAITKHICSLIFSSLRYFPLHVMMTVSKRSTMVK